MSEKTEQSSAELEWKRRFPAMRPLKSPPLLFRLNGCGLGMYGKRALDPETGTYIKTRCLCLLFVPVLPLDSYRVADAESGWYFLGKHTPSVFARTWRLTVLLVLGVMIAAAVRDSHIKSPEYVSRQAREEAAALAGQGQALKAADVYRRLILEGTGAAGEWRAEISKLLRQEIGSGDSSRAAAAVAYAETNRAVPGSREPLVADLAGVVLAASAAYENPAAVEAVLSQLKPAPADAARVHEARKVALEKLFEVNPEDPALRIKLALIREEGGEIAGALELLEPAADGLADGEGARLYGNLLVGEGRPEEALPHLERYVAARMEGWRKAEAYAGTAYEAARERAFNRLNMSGGPPGFMQRYEAASEAEQAQLVEEAIGEMLANDAVWLAARDHYEQAMRIVPTIMNIGVARLRVAQAEPDPALRKAHLDKSEEAFLSLRNVAGESDEYRLFLGQIYFWSGREPEGRVLFDELLASQERGFTALCELAQVFRSLGEDEEARKLLDEAFPLAADEQEIAGVVGLRSLLARNIDEKIEWLGKAKDGSPQLAISLTEARGQKAEETGDLEAAARYYQVALKAYEAREERDAVNMNNRALLYQALYRLGGKRADLDMSARLLSEAVEISPGNSILSFNAADTLLSSAVCHAAGDRVHPALLQLDGGLGGLQFAYSDESEKSVVLDRLKADPNFRKALGYFWDALLLAPKNPAHYGWGVAVFDYLADEAALERLAAKAAEQQFDFTAQRDERTRYLAKESDREIRASLDGYLKRVEAITAGLDDPQAAAMGRAFTATTRLARFSIGEPSGAGAWLDDLQTAAEIAPCSRLRSGVEAALIDVALEKLAAEDPACAAIIEANRRLLGAQDIFVLLLRARGELGDRVRGHAAVVAAREASDGVMARFPSSVNLGEWLVLDGLNPEMDAGLREKVMSNRSSALGWEVRALIQPESPQILLIRFWMAILHDDLKSARELSAELESLGVLLPELL